MSKFAPNIVQLSRTTDKRILNLTRSENQMEVFQQINTNRIQRDTLIFKKCQEEKVLLKKMKSSMTTPQRKTLKTFAIN